MKMDELAEQYIKALSFYRSIVLLLHCSMAPLFYCSIVLIDGFSNSILVLTDTKTILKIRTNINFKNNFRYLPFHFISLIYGQVFPGINMLTHFHFEDILGLEHMEIAS